MRIKVRAVEKKTVVKPISTDFIRVDAFLKMNDAVQSGGHAKIVINDGEVKVNGAVCTQRGKKLRKGDRVEYNRVIYEVG